VRVHCRDGSVISCQRVVVAVPPHHAQKLHFTPALPYLRQQLMSRAFIGCIIKNTYVYRAPFWVSLCGCQC
jgi:monoamine oxidase